MTTTQATAAIDLEQTARPFIDSDSHVEEHEDVFRYLDAEYAHRRPYIVDVPGLVSWQPERDRLWLIDGEIRPKLFGRNPSCYGTPNSTEFARRKPVTPSVQGIEDVDEYIECMSSIGLDTTVIYTTLFLHPVTRDPHFEAALMRAWNTWMAERCGQRPDKLRFGALIPLSNPPAAAAEVRRAAEIGATSIMVAPAAGYALLHDRRFDPVYEALSDTGLPLCVHVSWGHQGVNDTLDSVAASLVLNFEMSMMFGLFSFLAGGILDRFPDLKVAFLEAGAVWLPTMLDRLEKWRPTPTAEPWPARKAPMEYIRDHQLFFTVEGDEANLGEFVNLVGEDRILGSADFPHVHYAGGKLGSTFSDLRDHPDLTPEQKRLILGRNAEKFYGLAVASGD